MAAVRSLVQSLRQRPAAADALLALVLASLAQLEVWTLRNSGPPRPVQALAALVALLALAWRRRAPLASALVAVGVLTLVSVFWRTEGNWVIFALLIPTYTVARHREMRSSLAIASLGLVFVALATAQEDNENFGQFLGNYLFIAVLMIGTPWAAGRAVRSRQLRAVALEDRAEALERESEERARAAVAEERLRIARELHDVVGHSLGVIAVQAGAERATLKGAQDSTRETLITIEEASRAALDEMRRLLEMMRRDDEEVALAPQPSLAHIETLVENVRAAGLPVDLHVEGHPVPLPHGVDLSAYRIVQEALTNALKHAGPARVRVTVRYEADGLALEVADDGTGDAGEADGGHGLIGMRERVALYGGSLSTGARPGGGYAVGVRLPFHLPAP
jgi:signal transduction histidine kinase